MPTSRDLAIFVQTMTTTTIALRCGWSAGNSTRNFMLGVPVPVQSNSMLGTVLEAGKLRVPIPDSHAFASWYHIGMVVYDQLSGDGSNLIPSLSWEEKESLGTRLRWQWQGKDQVQLSVLEIAFKASRS